MSEMVLRPANLDDSDRLFQWRNDPQTRAASRKPGGLGRAEHQAWLEDAVSRPDRQLLIAEVDGQAVGTVRADRGDEGCEISWTVAPAARGQGIGQRMVLQLVAQLEGRLWSEVRSGNEASSRIAESAGMKLVEQKEGVKYYVRDAR